MSESERAEVLGVLHHESFVDQAPASMYANLLDDGRYLGVTRSHSRPHYSNDNPFSETHFKTLKYRRTFLDGSARSRMVAPSASAFFRWYNHEHRHSSIGFHELADVHFGHAGQAQLERVHVLHEAYAAHPEHFVRQAPVPPALPAPVWTNKPVEAPATP